ncbi:MAG: insulinase family protein [Candidatus Azobacteroides sp.]|nr:insulinase family protein [Candidatus Azobacteroides sp.]
MSLNRNIQPQLLPITSIDIPDPVSIRMPNNVPFHYLEIGQEEVVRVDIIINSGKWETSRPLVAEFTNQLLKEGAGRLTSNEIAEQLDFHGAWFQTSTTQRSSWLTLYTLNKFFDELLPLLDIILKKPVFPEKEFDVLSQNRKKDFLINLDKVNFLAARKLPQVIFGEKHPYGRLASLEDFDTLSLDELKRFYRDNYYTNNMEVALFGKIQPEMQQQLEQYFGQDCWGKQGEKQKKNYEFMPSPEKYIPINKPDALQSAIYVGKQIIPRTHPDYHGLFVLNTIFGGYFGSRLMSNIREDKGYTYGIYSSISPYPDTAYLAISTQVGTEHVENTISEIYKEMDKLCQEPVPEKELTTVRNYLLGELSRKFDNPFAFADIYLGLMEAGLTKSFYEDRARIIREISAMELRELAQRYLVKDTFYEVVAGKL